MGNKKKCNCKANEYIKNIKKNIEDINKSSYRNKKSNIKYGLLLLLFKIIFYGFTALGGLILFMPIILFILIRSIFANKPIIIKIPSIK
jgi:hypothetical protein